MIWLGKEIDLALTKKHNLFHLLTDRERIVIEGRCNGMTRKAIGLEMTKVKDSTPISGERVRQIESKALRRCRKEMIRLEVYYETT